MPVSVAELNRIIKRIKEVQKRFGNGNMQKGDLDTSFEGRTERCKDLLRTSDEVRATHTKPGISRCLLCLLHMY
jgi:hypothetical protein